MERVESIKQQLTLDPLTKQLLFDCGMKDRKAGLSYYDGWQQICTEMGWHHGRTPARECYEDGWYSVQG